MRILRPRQNILLFAESSFKFYFLSLKKSKEGVYNLPRKPKTAAYLTFNAQRRGLWLKQD